MGRILQLSRISRSTNRPGGAIFLQLASLIKMSYQFLLHEVKLQVVGGQCANIKGHFHAHLGRSMGYTVNMNCFDDMIA